MELEQTQSFNQKLSQWIASQGFWFQLRHSISGGGGWAMTLGHLMRLGFKVLLALLLGAGGFGIWLVKRVTTESFADSLNSSVKQGLVAEQSRVDGFSRNQGDASITRVGARGSKGSFFHKLDVGNVKFKMGLLAGMTGPWDAGTLSAKWMKIDVKAGAENAKEAEESAAALFRDWQDFKFSLVEVDEAAVRWGYSGRTEGRIEKSRMKARRSPDGWYMEFVGGTFSQNWLQRLEIVSLTMECTPQGLKISKGEFKVGTGSVRFRDVEVKGGEKPVVSGMVELSKVELARLLPESLEAYVEGVVSGELQLSGSTNSAEGVGFEGDIVLGGGNVINLRDKFPIFKSVARVDIYNSYKRIDLNHGSFHMKTGGGAMELTRVDVKAESRSNQGAEPETLITFQGRLKATVPPDVTEPQPLGNGVMQPMDNPPQVTGSAKGTGGDVTLEKAGAAAAEEQKAANAMFKGFQDEDVKRDRQEKHRNESSGIIRFEGGFRVSIPGDAFETSEILRQTFPVDPGSGRVVLDVPIDGFINELTARQAKELEDLSEQNRR